MSEHATDLVKRWRDGDQAAAEELFHLYQQRLLDLVARHLGEKLRGRLSPDDMVQSILKSMFRVTRDQSLEFCDDSGFWKWLVTVALNKTFHRIDKELAAKRDPGRETSAYLDMVISHRGSIRPSVEETVQVADLLECILQRLTEDQQQVLQLKLEGHQQTEIALRLGVSEKTVQRRMQQIREAAQSVVGDDGPPLT